MRLDGTFRNEHSFRDFGIGVPVGCKNHRLAFPLRQSVEHGASLVPARLRLLHVQIVDVLRCIGFGDKTLGACLDGPLHGPARTQGRQYQHMRRLRKCAQSSCRLDAVHAGHGYIHQHHIRMMPAGLVDRLTAIGAGENDIEPAGGIIFENQPHGLANHRIVINHANRYRPVIAVLFAAHSTHGSCTSTWNACRASKPNRHVPPACRTRSANPGNPAPVWRDAWHPPMLPERTD